MNVCELRMCLTSISVGRFHVSAYAIYIIDQPSSRESNVSVRVNANPGAIKAMNEESPEQSTEFCK